MTLRLFSAPLALAGALLCAPPVKTPLGPEPALGAKVVEVSERDVVAIATRLRFTTMIMLPKGEQILDFVCGDKEFWVVNGAQNFAFIKPAKAGSQTNLNLITASGSVYSFVVREVGESAVPDLKVFIEPKDGTLLSSVTGAPQFVPAQAVDDYRQQVEIAQAAAKKAKDDAAQQVAAAHAEMQRERDRVREHFPASLVFDYAYRDQPGFGLDAIYHDDRFTYIKANPQETPAVYEIKDGKPSLIQFRYSNGLYTMDKIIDRGYLALGKQRLHFTREGQK